MTKRMTRLLSLILTLVMFLSVVTPAYAVGSDDEPDEGWDREIGEDEIHDLDIDGDLEFEEEYDYFQALDEENGVQVTIEAPMGSLPTLAEVRLEPIPAEDLMDAVEDLLDADHQILLAMDISFWLGEDEIEPEEPVRVKISAPELEGCKDLTVVHFPDDAEEPETIQLIPEEDLTFALGTNEICFESADFSVYAVIGGSANDLKLTVEFYESATATTPLSTQVLVLEQFDEEGEKPLIDPGVPTITATQSFEGWRIDAEHEKLDINGLNTYIHETYGEMTADATLRVNAMIFNVRYVIYHDQAGAVLKTQSFHVEEGGTTSVMISHPYVAFQSGQNFQAWTLEEDVSVAGDYPLYKDSATAEGHLYQNDTVYNLSETLDLFPFVQTGEWLIFDNNLDQDSDSTSASYTSPVFVPAGTNTSAPAVPTRTGYTFGGWFKDEAMTSQFVFGSTISQETTVYAKWIPAQAQYTVVFWQQNSTDAVDAADSEKTYSFYKSVERTATTGQTAELNLANSGTTADNRLGGNDASSIGEMGFYFAFNETNSTPTSKVVKGDGSTVLNVYYDRKVITYNFYADLTSYTYSSSTYNANYPYYGVDSDGYLFRVYRSGYYWYTNTSYSTRYTGNVYHLTFSTSTSPTSSNRIQFGSIQGLYGSTMDSFTWNANTTVSGEDWPYCGQYLMWHDETTGRYQNRMFQYTTGEATTATTVNYYLNEYVVESNTRPYTCLGQDTSGNYTIELDSGAMKSTETLYLAGDEYFGYVGERYNRTSNNYNSGTAWTAGQTITCSYDDIGSNGHAYFYYARNKWDFVYESNSSKVKTESIYWEGSLSDLASFVPTNGPDGCYFDGWYADPGFGTPFDFSQEMPNHAVQVYAKWTVTRYRIVLDPTGGEAGVEPSDITFPGNQVTTFRVDYGEKVEDSSINNAERAGYTLLGWYLDKEYTQPYNFANPVTDDVADMSYANASDAERQGTDPWNPENPTYTDVGRPNVRGKVTIYAHWRKDPNGIIGINIRYDAVESAAHEGYFGSDQTNTIWDDPDIYADQAQAYAQPASTPKEYNPALKFLYWDILDKNGQSSGRKAYPGQTWEVHFADAVEEPINDGNAVEEPEFLTFDRGNLNIIRPGQADVMANEAITTTIASWDFEDGVQGWTFYNTDNGNSSDVWSRYNGTAHNSSYCLRASSYNDTTAQQNQAYSPTIQIPANGVTTVSLYARSAYSGNSGDSFRVAYHPDGDEYIYFISPIVTPGNSYTQYSYEIDSVTTDDGTVNFKGTSGEIVLYHNATFKYYLYVDDVTVTNVTTTVYHTVTFVDGLTNDTITTVQVEDGLGAAAPQPPDHTGDGYIFNGWDTDFSYVTSDLIVTAQYVDQSLQFYTVTFRYMQSNGEWTSVSQQVQHNQGATPPDLPDPPAGFTFNSWDRHYDHITSNITINAVYKQVATMKYVVTLRAVYGRADAGSITHINWYSNKYDAYGNPIPDASTATTYKATSTLFPGGSIEENPSREDPATFAYEGNPTYGENGYNLVYDNVEIPESVLIPEKPYAIPGYKFLGWARIADPNSIPEGASASAYVTDPSQITPDDVYIRWVEDNSETGAGHYEAKGSIKLSQNYSLVGYWSGADQNTGYQFNNNGTLTVTFNTDAYVSVKEPGGAWYMIDGTYSAGTTGSVLVKKSGEKLFVPGNTEVTFTLTENSDGSLFLSYVEGRPETQGDENWVPVTYVAANEQKPYHDMYAVWVGEFYIYHSGMEGGAVEKVTIDFKGGYDLTARVTALSQSRADEADKFLYGGYYLKGGFTAPAVDDKGVPTATCAAYNGANWTWTTPVTDQPGNAITPKGGVTYYIKEVPASSYLQSYFHYTYKKEPLPENQTLSSAWVISAIDDAMYKETGFVIIKNNDKANVCTQLTVETAVGGTKVVLKPQNIFRSKDVKEGDFLSYLEVMTNGTKNLGFDENVTVLQYWVTPDNMIVTGIAGRTYSGLDLKANLSKEELSLNSTIGVFSAPAAEPEP